MIGYALKQLLKWRKKRYRPNEKAYSSVSRCGETFQINHLRAFRSIYHAPIMSQYIPDFSFSDFYSLKPEEREGYLETHVTAEDLTKFIENICFCCSDAYGENLKLLGYVDRIGMTMTPAEFFVRDNIVITFEMNTKSYLGITQFKDRKDLWSFFRLRTLTLD